MSDSRRVSAPTSSELQPDSAPYAPSASQQAFTKAQMIKAGLDGKPAEPQTSNSRSKVSAQGLPCPAF